MTKKIILCLHHFLPEFLAGTEMYVLRLAQALQRKGKEVAVLIPYFDSNSSDVYEWEGVRVIRYAEDSVEDRQMILGFKKPGGLHAFAEVLLNEKPDIVHFHELAPGRGLNIFHVRKTRELNIPVILTFHLSSYTCMKGSLIFKDNSKCDGKIFVDRCTDCIFESRKISGTKGALLRATSSVFFKLGADLSKTNTTWGTAIGYPFIIDRLKRDLLELAVMAEKIIVVGKWYRQVLEDNGVPPEKIVYIKQGLTSGLTNMPGNAKPVLPLKLVFIGRINPLKGLHLLVDAVSRMAEDKISLHIYGKETDDAFSNELKEKSRPKKNITWMGMLAPKEVVQALSNFDLLCLPSTFSEMSPLVIQEAFAAGIPVLASDVRGNAEQIVEGVNGWLFRFNDSEALRQKLQRLVDDIDLIQKARQHLPNVSDFGKVADEHTSVYDMIVHKNAMPGKKQLAQ